MAALNPSHLELSEKSGTDFEPIPDAASPRDAPYFVFPGANENWSNATPRRPEASAIVMVAVRTPVKRVNVRLACTVKTPLPPVILPPEIVPSPQAIVATYDVSGKVGPASRNVATTPENFVVVLLKMK